MFYEILKNDLQLPNLCKNFLWSKYSLECIDRNVRRDGMNTFQLTIDICGNLRGILRNRLLWVLLDVLLPSVVTLGKLVNIYLRPMKWINRTTLRGKSRINIFPSVLWFVPTGNSTCINTVNWNSFICTVTVYRKWFYILFTEFKFYVFWAGF